MARITFEADTPEQLAADMRIWLLGASPEDGVDKFEVALRKMTPLTREIVVAIAEASARGGQLVLDADTVRRFGKEDGGQLGGAFANIWRAFGASVERDVLHHVQTSPAAYFFTKEDADIILAAAKKILNG